MAHILLVDDDQTFLDTASEAIQALGHTTSCATNQFDAVELVEPGVFNLAFVDVIMPGGGAITAVNLLKEKDHDLPIIAMTGMWTVRTSPVMQVGLHNAAAKIEKTYRLAELDELIKKYANSSETSAPITAT